MFTEFFELLKFSLPVVSTKFFHFWGQVSGSRFVTAAPHLVTRLLPSIGLAVLARENWKRASSEVENSTERYLTTIPMTAGNPFTRESTETSPAVWTVEELINPIFSATCKTNLGPGPAAERRRDKLISGTRRFGCSGVNDRCDDVGKVGMRFDAISLPLINRRGDDGSMRAATVGAAISASLRFGAIGRIERSTMSASISIPSSSGR